MNANAITSKSGKPRARPKSTSGNGRKRNVQRKVVPTRVKTESLVGFHERELRSFITPGRSSTTEYQREVEAVAVPLDGSYVAKYYRVAIDDSSRLITAQTRLDGLQFERVIWHGSMIDVGSAQGKMANGWHAIGFVADPRLEPPAGETDSDRKEVALPHTIEGLSRLQYMQKGPLTKALSVRVGMEWLHRCSNFAPMRVQGIEEDHPVEFVSPGWWVYVVGGFTNVFDTGLTQALPPMRIQHRYKLSFIEPAPANVEAEPVRSSHHVIGPFLPITRAVAAMVGRNIAPNLRAQFGYTDPVTLTDIASADTAAKAEHHSGKAADGDMWLEPRYADLVSSMASSSIANFITGYFSTQLQQAARATLTRDVVQADWKRLITKIKLGYSVLSVGGTISESTSLTGRVLDSYQRIFVPTKDPQVAQWPGDYIEALTYVSKYNKTSLDSPPVISQNPPPTPVYSYTAVTVDDQVATFEANYRYGSSEVLQAQNSSNVDSSAMIRPARAFVDPSTLLDPARQTLGTNLNVVGNLLVSIRNGLRPGDVVETYFRLQNFTAGGDVPLPPVDLQDVIMTGIDIEYFGSNDGRRFSKISDSFV